jgi:uncharacterized protein
MLVIPQIFFSGDLKLEGTFHLPRGSEEKVAGVVLCHPHPLYGGNMHNNVVLAVNQALVEMGIAAFRFNFRGVGSSEGSFDNGAGEQNDLQAAVAALVEHQEVDPDRLGIMGYSFGGMVALMAVKSSEQVRALAAVSPVVTPGLMEGINLPAYFISGKEDHVVSADLLIREAKKINPPGKVELVAGADHLWFGREKEMAIKVAAFFKEVL